MFLLATGWMPQQTDFEMKIGIREVFYEGAQNQIWEVKEAMLSQQRPSHLHGDWHVPSQLPYIDIRGQELITTHLPVIGCGLPTITYLQWDMILGKAALLPIIPADETMFFESLKWRTGKVYHRITLGHSESLVLYNLFSKYLPLTISTPQGHIQGKGKDSNPNLFSSSSGATINFHLFPPPLLVTSEGGVIKPLYPSVNMWQFWRT